MSRERSGTPRRVRCLGRACGARTTLLQRSPRSRSIPVARPRCGSPGSSTTPERGEGGDGPGIRSRRPCPRQGREDRDDRVASSPASRAIHRRTGPRNPPPRVGASPRRASAGLGLPPGLFVVASSPPEPVGLLLVPMSRPVTSSGPIPGPRSHLGPRMDGVRDTASTRVHRPAGPDRPARTRPSMSVPNFHRRGSNRSQLFTSNDPPFPS